MFSFRYPSGNNNTSINVGTRHAPHCFVRKSSSLPNLQLQQINQNQLHVSQAISTSTVDSYGKMRTLLPMFPMPVSTSDSESPAPLLQQSNSSNGPPPNQPSFNLVKLFIKQKSNSTDTCMDVSSGCWPSDSSSSIEHRQRKKSMNDSGKGSALSRHDEDNENDFQYDSLDVVTAATGAGANTGAAAPKQQSNRSNDLYREVFDSPSHRNYKECHLNIRNYQQKQQQFASINNNNNNSMEKDSLKETNKSLSDTSRTSENITQVFTKGKVSVDVITRSIQTSILLKDRIKVVPPSFLAQLNQNNKIGESKRAPVYVIYPNYALPNLDFVNQSEIILSPVGYKESSGMCTTPTSSQRKRRPISLADVDELIKKKEYKHVVDWKSLAPLLPIEYRNLLKHIPEVESVTVESMAGQRPMFCMSPPIRRTRPVSCDCASYYNTSSSGGSSDQQPPSSGYRGSSTMLLTDSEFDMPANNNDPMKNMYVYQYENSHMDSDSSAERPPSGRIPPAPRGILRRTNSKTKSKRNSMFEENSATTVHTADKRRSLQEPYYATTQTHNIIEDYLAELNDHEYMVHRLNNSRVYATNKQFEPLCDNASKLNKTNLNYIMELNEEAKRHMTTTYDQNDDLDARNRAEHFLSNVPKSELKYYAEVANILESIDKSSTTEPYDRNKLRNEVSRALSQKKVSFNGSNDSDGGIMGNTMTITSNINNNNNNSLLAPTAGCKEFTTPPNSPNISITALRLEQKQKHFEQEKQDKIQSNRFKRLQIQWELLSKEASTLEEELVKETRSGGSTPTSANGGALKSKIPRPVSYPATK